MGPGSWVEPCAKQAAPSLVQQGFFGRCPVGKHRDPTSPAKFSQSNAERCLLPVTPAKPEVHFLPLRNLARPCPFPRRSDSSQQRPLGCSSNHPSRHRVRPGRRSGNIVLADIAPHPRKGQTRCQGPPSPPKANTGHLVLPRCPVLPKTTVKLNNQLQRASPYFVRYLPIRGHIGRAVPNPAADMPPAHTASFV